MYLNAFIAMLLIQFWVTVGTLFTGWNDLHDRIILLKRNVGVHTTSLTPTLRSQNSEHDRSHSLRSRCTSSAEIKLVLVIQICLLKENKNQQKMHTVGTNSILIIQIYIIAIIRYDLVVCIQTFPNLALFRVLSKTRGRHLSTCYD
jgi:hypothetical protein